MATSSSRKTICKLKVHRTLELEKRKPIYNGIVLIDDKLIGVDSIEKNLKVYNRHDGKLITAHRLESLPEDVGNVESLPEDVCHVESLPEDVCLVSKKEVAVCLSDGRIEILSLIDGVKLVKTLWTRFHCDSLAKWKSDKLVVSGEKDSDLCWGILSIRDGRMVSTHDICKGFGHTRMTFEDNTVYISCWTSDPISSGVYAYDILEHTQKFLYRHQELRTPWSVIAGRNCVYVCDRYSARIHRLSTSGQLLNIIKVLSELDGIFCDDRHILHYTTGFGSKVITVNKMEFLHQPVSRSPNYRGVVVMDDKLLVTDMTWHNIQVHSCHDGKLISTSHRLQSCPQDVCLISKTKVAVCLEDGTILIMSLESIGYIQPVKTLKLPTEIVDISLAKLNSDKLVISGLKTNGNMLCWGILSITDGHLDSIHDICNGRWTCVAVKDNTVYISCWTCSSITKGLYAYDISNPHRTKFLYQQLKCPGQIMADRDYVYVCDQFCGRIHQLTNSGQLVTILKVSLNPERIFYDDQHKLLYTTSYYTSNVITIYKVVKLIDQPWSFYIS